MVKLRHLFLFLTLTASVIVAKAASLTAEEVVAKARAAVAKEPNFLERVKGLYFEIKFTDVDNKPLSAIALEIAGPRSRREIAYDNKYQFEIITATNGLEGWKISREIRGQKKQKNEIITFDQVAVLRDTTANELSFYKAPAAGTGTLTSLGTQEVNGKKVYSLEYSYNSGFKIIRHFGFNNFELVAYDQVGLKGDVQRQQVEETIWIEGICFVKRETVLLNGKKVAEAVYEKTQVNPESDPKRFVFPTQ